MNIMELYQQNNVLQRENEMLGERMNMMKTILGEEGKTLERLKKENKWLIDRVTQAQFLTGLEMRKKQLLQEMQQALKGELND